jgi:hypothetical protein
VFVERDPAAVLASVAATEWYETVGKAPRVLALWRENVASMRAWRDPRVLRVRYEELVAQPERELARIAAHADLAGLDASLAAHKVRGFEGAPRLSELEHAALRDERFAAFAASVGYPAR